MTVNSVGIPISQMVASLMKLGFPEDETDYLTFLIGGTTVPIV